MYSPWPEGFSRIPDEEWVRQPVEELALNYDSVEDHGWYRNLDRTIEDLSAYLEDGHRLIDYSGGTGILAQRLFEEIEQRRFGILLVDSSPKFLRLAFEKLGRRQRMAFRLIRYLKEEKRIQSLQEVCEPALLDAGVDALVSTNAIHLYYGLPDTLASWCQALRPGGRVFVQSGNIGLPSMPEQAWIIDETVDAIHERAQKLVAEDDRWQAYRPVLGESERMAKHDALRQKFFLPVRPLSYYTDALEQAGFDILEVAHRSIEAHVDQWYEFLATYHEGVLGWVGGSRRIEGQDPTEDAVQDRLTLIRESLESIFEGRPSFSAMWTYINGVKRG